MVPSRGILRVHRCAHSGHAIRETDMNLLRIVFPLLLVAVAPVRADDAADVRALVAEYDRAYLAADPAAVGALLADDYRVVVEGRLRDRGTVLAELIAPEREASTALSSTVDRVWNSGDLAVATGRIEWRSAKDHGNEHFTLVARRDGGKWRVVSEHISDVARDAAD